MASGPISSQQIEVENVEAVTDYIYLFIFLASKITADGDCSHEIKRCLFFGRKAMKNVDTLLKHRHHFANKDQYSQSMVFPVVMCRGESWTIRKAEC